ncbi:MAG: hypothetical protein HQ506_02160 [Candidatus Marinimicrobia bacterium]|nr:hypothetical protein [Candidatus Neomarinimicrobiota bacterium]
MKIGFAIAVYDKYEEVEVCADIIKTNFKKISSYICVGSNNPQIHDHLGTNPNIDRIVAGEDLKQLHHTSKKRFNLSIGDVAVSVMRTASNTFASVNHLIQVNVDYIVILHSDSWILNQDKLIGLIEIMEKNEKSFAFRDLNFYYTHPFSDKPSPYLVDFFMVVKKEFIVENNIFNFDSFSLIPGILTNVHSLFFYLIAIKIGWKNVLCYSSYKNFQFWDETPVYYNRYLAPYAYDPLFENIHINVGSFFDNLGEALQAKILKEKMLVGPYIDKFVDKYFVEPHQLAQRLEYYDNHYSRKLKFRLLNFKTSGLSRSHRYINQYLKESRFHFTKNIKRVIHARLLINKNAKYSLFDTVKQSTNEADIISNGHTLWYRDIYPSSDDIQYIRNIK